MELKYTRAEVAAHGEKARLLIELEYSEEEILIGLNWEYVDLRGLSSSEVTRIHNEGSLLRKKRVASACKQRKVRVNEPCPCGGGRKYKHCCQNRVNA